eukprot:UN15908
MKSLWTFAKKRTKMLTRDYQYLFRIANAAGDYDAQYVPDGLIKKACRTNSRKQMLR